MQVDLIKEALGYHFYDFQGIIQMAESNPNVLLDDDVKRKILFFLKLN